MRTGRWEEACVASLKAVELDPLQSSAALRLATCYEKERQYVKAYDWLQRGISLIPSVEREQAQLEKLAWLRRHAEDAKSNVRRVDPSLLPKELFTIVMQYGLLEDRHFVLKSTWVSKR
jgi:tetratricopeptide (TPR) repeat protein